jgi:hypothetical protein
VAESTYLEDPTAALLQPCLMWDPPEIDIYGGKIYMSIA